MSQNDEVPTAHKWASEGTSILSGKDFNRVNKIKYDCMMTGYWARTYSNKKNTGHCPEFFNEIASLAHMLQVCPRTHGPHIKRHNARARLSKDRASKKGWKVLLEPLIVTGEGMRKQDLIMLKEEEKRAKVMTYP